jgi:hypothetical protein
MEGIYCVADLLLTSQETLADGVSSYRLAPTQKIKHLFSFVFVLFLSL